MTRFLVLRSNGPESYLGAALGADQADEEWRADAVDGSDSDAAELREDPRNRVVVDAEMLLAGVSPCGENPDPHTDLLTCGSLRMTRGLYAVGAHTTRFTGHGVTVAVIDTGIDGGHPVFEGKTLVIRNFTTEGGPEDCRDSNGHGTHCAGTICGAPFEGIRVGVAPGVNKLCVGKVLGSRGATVESLVRALLWAVVENKADVVSLSLTYDLPGNTERLVRTGISAREAANLVLRQQADLIRTVTTLRAFLESQVPNLMLVAASGNESERPRFAIDAGLPAAELLSVGAVGPHESGERWTVASFSNGRANLVAPGVSVLSAGVGGGWKSLSGTSMATPHVAGVAALWTEKARREGAIAIPNTVRSWLIAHSNRSQIADLDRSAIGNGMVQAPQA